MTDSEQVSQNEQPRVLIVEDEKSMGDMLATDFRLRGTESVWCANAEEAAAALRKSEFDVVLTDINMPGISGLQLCDQVTRDYPDIPVIVMTAFGNMETAISAIRAGAYDFVPKPVELELLALTIARAVKQRRLHRQVKRLSQKISGKQSFFGDLIGESTPMLELYDQLERIADSQTSILLTGESGTGKELVARTIHQKSSRAEKPFVAINCAAIPDALLESELFGYEKGAFTGATHQVKGKIETADRGTLFLDEIGDMPFNLQAKLLRFVEERRIERLGGRQPIDVDVRIVSATHQPLMTRVAEEQFRQDLLYRLAGLTIEIPALRARGDDALLLAQHFVETFAAEHGRPSARLAEDAKRVIMAHGWPGNIRELANLIQRAVILAEGRIIKASDLKLDTSPGRSGYAVAGPALQPQAEFISLRDARDQAERQAVDAAVKKSEGNLSTAAKLLGISRPTLYSLLRRHDDLQPSGSTEA
ncbi:MAG: PEP-CTERM-box response regulator transcription factor [Geminicoccaceae bacterium]